MKTIVLLISFLGLLSDCYSQRNNSLHIIDSLNKKVDSIFRSDKAFYNSNTLDDCLRRDFRKNSDKDGRWVYYPESANIQKLYSPLISDILPLYSFYSVTMTNILGYHVNRSKCLVLFDSLKKRTELVEPIWYSDENKTFLNHFIGRQFADSNSLLKFVYELQDLLLVGTSGKFLNTKYQPDKINFDLTFGHVSESPGTTNTVSGIWRTFEIVIRNNIIEGIKVINPR